MTIDEMDGEWIQVYRKKRHQYPPYGYWHGGRDTRWDRNRAPYPPYWRERAQCVPVSGSRVHVPPAPPRGALGRQTQQRRTRDTPTDPAFGQMVRLFHKGIKMVHHLENVTPREGLPQPRMVTRTITNLATLIQPASPTSGTLDRIGDNAKVWGQNTIQILEEHYRSTLDSILAQISGKPLPGWEEAFQIATKWAYRNLPHVKKEVLDRAEVLIRACVEEDAQPEEPQPAPPPPQTKKTTKQNQAKQTSSTPKSRRDASTSTSAGHILIQDLAPAPIPTPQSEPQVRPVSRAQDPEPSLTPIQPSRLALPRDSPSSGSVGAGPKEASFRVSDSPGEVHSKEQQDKVLKDLAARMENRRKTRATFQLGRTKI